MIDVNPNPADGKWYTLQEAQERQRQLIRTMPTGTDWYWADASGSEVVFTVPSEHEGSQRASSEQLNTGERR